MKHRHMFALAGAAALLATSPVQATPTISVVFHIDPFLVANNLYSATISITGFQAGNRIQGFISTAGNPWVVRTNSGSGFFNIDTVPSPSSPSTPFFSDGVFAAPTNNAALNAINPAARWDSGLIGSLTAQPNPANLGSPADSDPDDNIGGFAMFSTGGNSDFDIHPAAWISTSPTGIAVNENSNFRVMRITWPANVSVRVDFVLAMNTPNINIPMTSFVTPIEPFGACCLPKGECTFTTAVGCFNQGGTFRGYQPCEIACPPLPPPCPADLAPPGGNDVVDVADLLAVIGAWGACGNPNDCPPDIAPPGGDDTVNVADLLAVISAWGACPP